MTSVRNGNTVEFRFYRPGVSSVHVAGDFNGWKRQGLPMRHTGGGWWVATADLADGEYRFRYIDRLDWKPRPALSFGQSLHAALESLYSQQTPHFPDLPTLLAMLDEVWVSDGK